MGAAVRFARDFAGRDKRREDDEAPVLGLASAVAVAAAGGLLGLSLLTRRGRLAALYQFGLGVVAGCAGVVTWQKRQQEMEAARHFVEHVHEVRDARWLKKHPIAYG